MDLLHRFSMKNDENQTVRYQFIERTRLYSSLFNDVIETVVESRPSRIDKFSTRLQVIDHTLRR